jgi:hypothetical protein
LGFQFAMLIYEMVAALVICVLVGLVLLPVLLIAYLAFVFSTSMKLAPETTAVTRS